MDQHLWNMFGNEAERLEKTWNISQRLMLGLDRKTHRFFIEPLSGTQHIIFNLYNRFVTFTQKLSQSKKGSLRNLFNAVKDDCRSTTGYNFRKLMLRFNVSRPEEVNPTVINRAIYNEVPTGDEWKLKMAKELIDVRCKENILPYFHSEEISTLIEYITT